MKVLPADRHEAVLEERLDDRPLRLPELDLSGLRVTQPEDIAHEVEGPVPVLQEPARVLLA